MANEKRLRANFLGGLVDTADLASGGTTLNSAALAAFPVAVDTTNHAAITLDPDGIYGAPEIAYITALTLGAASATIVRGQEGTTARQHLLDTPWVHAPTVRDVAVGRLVKKIQTGGNYTINNLAWTELDSTNLRIAATAQVGDMIEVGLSAYVIPNSSIQYAALDAATIVSGSPVTYASNGTGTAASNGVPAWNIPGPASEKGVSGSVFIGPLTAGDISGGKVTVSMFFKTGNAVNHTVCASASDPLQFWVVNHGPQEA